MKVKIKVLGERELDREMKRLRKKLKLKGGEYADLGARAVRDGVLRNTQPFGLGKVAYVQGIKAVRRDVWRCFRVVGDNGVRRIGVITTKGEAKAFHKSRRGSKGTVRKGEKKTILATVFYQYLKEVESRVGLAKGSMLGGDDPKMARGGKALNWANPHRKEGDAQRKAKKSGAEWKFSGDPSHLTSGNVLGVRGLMKVKRLEKRLVYGFLKRDMRAALKKEQKRVNRG